MAFGALLTMPALAASPAASSATPQVPCCGGGGGGYPNATVHASASSYDVNYALIASTSSGWHSGADVYMYFQVEYPDGAYTSSFLMGECLPSGGSCNPQTTWKAPECAGGGTYHVFV